MQGFHTCFERHQYFVVFEHPYFEKQEAAVFHMDEVREIERTRFLFF